MVEYIAECNDCGWVSKPRPTERKARNSLNAHALRCKGPQRSKKIKESACPPHPLTRQRWTEFADPDGEAPTYEALVCLDCGRQLHPKDEEDL